MPQLKSDRQILDLLGQPVTTWLRIRSPEQTIFNHYTLRIDNGRIASNLSIAPGLYQVAWGCGRWEDILIIEPFYQFEWDVPDTSAIELLDLQENAIQLNGSQAGFAPDFAIAAIKIDPPKQKPRKRVERSIAPSPNPSPVPSPSPNPSPSPSPIPAPSPTPSPVPSPSPSPSPTPSPAPIAYNTMIATTNPIDGDVAAGITFLGSLGDEFQFNSVSTGDALPASMFLAIGSATNIVASVTFPARYIGSRFSYRNASSGTIYNATSNVFANNAVIVMQPTGSAPSPAPTQSFNTTIAISDTTNGNAASGITFLALMNDRLSFDARSTGDALPASMFVAIGNSSNIVGSITFQTRYLGDRFSFRLASSGVTYSSPNNVFTNNATLVLS